MRRNRRHDRAQLVLELERQHPQTAKERPPKGLVEALADLLLEALVAEKNWEAWMSPKITPDHLGRAAVVYVRQSTMAQVTGNLESQRRQYDLAKAAEAAGFASVTVIDDDLGRSGSGSMQRPGFERLVAMVCSGEVGAVYCIEASRLARNGRDWHHLIDLCALAGALVVDPDGAYDPQIVNDRLLLGLKGTMSEYELSLMRQRGIAARDSRRSAANSGSCCRLAFAGAKLARSRLIRTSALPAPSVLCSRSSANWVARGRSSYGCGRPTSGCPSSCAMSRSVSSFGRRPPITASCRFFTIRFTPALMPLAGGHSEHALSMDVRARPAALQSRGMNGMFCCATIILATSAGRSTRTIRRSYLRTRT